MDVKGWRGALSAIGLVLLALAVLDELRRPPGERRWHGRLFGLIPYDFRLPTPRRLIASVWDPSNPRLFTGQAFGMGWSVNLAALFGRAAAASA